MYQSTFNPQGQQFQQAQPNQSFLSDKDLLHNLLNDLKRTAREYTTAATEANCALVRQLFMNLLESTLSIQAKLYQHMQQNNMYKPSSPVLRQELDKQIAQYHQTQQQTQQQLQQKSNFVQAGSAQPNSYQPIYM